MDMNKDFALPTKLSALLRLAVKDAQKAEKDPKYNLDMEVWHSPVTASQANAFPGLLEQGTCTICMAGAVIAKTMQEPIDKFLDPGDYSRRTGNCLEAIDLMREGHLLTAYRFLHNEPIRDQDHAKAVGHLEKVIRDAYDDDLERTPWETYLKVADELERLEL